ncbi:glycosyltransferase family 2 protein [Bifidobacterium felsineum]|uniref:Glycosyl transferase n=1 Tax=Bifidobacterium felsineum TaxID=2045440 RepID=A0A2M9HHV8_9BIFI|nr:glycosyltransferase family 2 protein [Bifidobacterium felsineum]PJM76396.1 glycosyl transferase [Bifidobacterium felsineum]
MEHKNNQIALVSVIIPAYNSESVISFCLDSILKQSYKNLEIIIVDDGSTDSTPEICDKYAQRDARIKVFHTINQGISEAQNNALDIVSGNYIIFCDNDDIIPIYAIEQLVDAIKKTNADIATGKTSVFSPEKYDFILNRKYSSYSTIVSISHTPYKDYENNILKISRFLFRKRKAYFLESTWGKLYKSTLWDSVRFPKNMFSQDVAVNPIVYSKAVNIVTIDSIIYEYCISGKSVSHNPSFKYICDTCTIALNNFNYALNDGILPYRSYFLFRQSLSVASRMYKTRDDLNQIQLLRNRYFYSKRKLPFRHQFFLNLVYYIHLLEVSLSTLVRRG